MYTNNTNEKYYLYSVKSDDTTNTPYWQLKRAFPNKDALISFLASHVATHGYEDSHRWTCDYFDNVNVTGSDTYIQTVQTTSTFELDGFRHFYYKDVSILRPYIFTTESGAIVDVRNFKDEVYARVHAKNANLLPKEDYSGIWWSYKHRYTTSHTCTYYHSNSHFYRRLLHSYEDEFEDNEGNLIKFKPKPKDTTAKYLWYDDFWKRGECGWKTHKDKRQWEHNLRNGKKRK